MKNSFLIGQRVYLRPLEESDLNGNYVRWLNNEQVCRYNSHGVFPYTKEDALAYIQRVREFKNSLVLAIVLMDSDRHIGNISLQNINFVNQNAEFAIILGESDCWGKGFSKEASFLIMKHGFMSLNLHRIYCGTSEQNLAMRKLALYLGMKEEGCRRQALFKSGRFFDLMEFGLIKSEFFEKFGLK